MTWLIVGIGCLALWQERHEIARLWREINGS